MDFNEAIRISPNHSDGYFKRGQSKISLLRYKEAEIDFETAHDMETLQMENEPGLKINAGILDG